MRIYTTLRLTALVAAVALLLAACTGPETATTGTKSRPAKGPNDPVRIGLSFDILNNIRQAEKSAIEAKAKEMNATVDFVVADSDAQRQVAQIDELMSRNVDAIIAIAQDKDAIAGAVKKANAAGVPFLTLDRPVTEGGEIFFHVSADPYSDGRVSAQYMAYSANAKKERLYVLSLVGALTDVNAIERNRGFKEEMQHWPNVTIVEEAETDWNPDKALMATRTTLDKHPDVNAIFCPSDFLLPSVLSALEAKGRLAQPGQPGHITIVSIDGDPFGYSKTTDGTISADVATLADVLGARVAEVAVQGARGQRPPTNREIVPGLLFTTENAQQVANKVWGAGVKP